MNSGIVRAGRLVFVFWSVQVQTPQASSTDAALVKRKPPLGLSAGGEGVATIAVLGLTRCVCKLASRRLVYGRASLSASGAIVPPTLPRMPQTNKSRNAPGGESPGAAQAGAPAEDASPVTRQEDLAAGEGNIGDGEIIKSPSDPKQYR